MIALRHGWRWGLLGAVWSLAVVGLIAKLAWMDAPLWLSTLLYVALGWVALAAFPGLVQAVPPAGIWWFVAGGSVFTGGAVIFVLVPPGRGPVCLRRTRCGTCAWWAAAPAASGPLCYIAPLASAAS